MPWTLDVLLFCVAGLVVSMAISGGWQFTFRGRVASMRTLYTPMLVLTLLACARLAWSYRPSLLAWDGRAVLRVATGNRRGRVRGGTALPRAVCRRLENRG